MGMLVLNMLLAVWFCQMGVVLHIDISKLVTKEEWNAVYNENLKLVETFPLEEKRKVPEPSFFVLN